MNSVSKVALAFSLMACGQLYADILAFNTDSEHFKLEKSATELKFQTSQGVERIKIEKCNRGIVESYWSAAVNDYLQFPLIAGKAPPEIAFASLNKEHRAVIPLPNRYPQVTTNSFYLLKLRGVQSCRR